MLLKSRSRSLKRENINYCQFLRVFASSGSTLSIALVKYI